MVVEPEVKPRAAAARPAPDAPAPRTVALSTLLDAWVAQQLITSAQAKRLQDADVLVSLEGPPRHRATGGSVAVEAFGYLGGVLVLSAAFSLAALYWGDLQSWQRLLALGGAAVALLVAGAVLRPAGPGPLARLRSVLWTASTAAVAGFLVLLGADSLAWNGPSVFVLVTAGSAAWAALLWWWDPNVLQQLTLALTTVLLAAAVALRLTQDDQLPGLAAWAVAATWFVLARRGVVAHRRVVSACAGVAAVVAAMTTFPSDSGIVLALSTAAVVIAVAARAHDVALLVVGSIALLQLLPMAITTWFPDTVAAPLALLLSGGLVVVGAVWSARRSRE